MTGLPDISIGKLWKPFLRSKLLRFHFVQLRQYFAVVASHYLERGMLDRLFVNVASGGTSRSSGG